MASSYSLLASSKGLSRRIASSSSQELAAGGFDLRLFQALADKLGTIFDQFAIFETEGRRKVTVNVEFAGNLFAHENGHDNLRLGFDRTRQVTRIAPDVVYDDSLSRRRSCTADSPILNYPLRGSIFCGRPVRNRA